MKYITIMVALLLTFSAHAGWEEQKPPMKPPMKPAPQVQQRQGQDQGQIQGQGQTQSASAAAGATAENTNSQSVGVDVSFVGGATDNNINFAAAEIPDDTPAVMPPSIFPANPCHMAFSMGGSVPGFGITGGKTYIDKNCQELEWIRMGYSLGMRDAAVWQWCSMDHGATNPKCKAAQDYNLEVQMLKLDNEHLLNDYKKQKDRADKAEENLGDWQADEAERRMEAAVSK